MYKKRKHKVLILAGGGLFGHIITYLLSNIECDFVRQIDTIAGTSIGGILALLYATCPDHKYINNQFELNGPKIFKKSIFDYLKIKGPKYSNNKLKQFIELFLQDYTLNDLFEINNKCLNIIIPTLDFNRSIPKVFDNIDIQDNQMPLVQLALATSAAPTYFPAIQYNDTVLIDGGVLENIPITTTIVTLMSKRGLSLEDMDVFVIGTGSDAVINDYNAKQVTNFTLGDWAFKFLVPYVTESNETCSMYWWTQPNLKFNSFNLFNPIHITGKMDDPNVLKNTRKWCEPHLQSFKDQFYQFLNN